MPYLTQHFWTKEFEMFTLSSEKLTLHCEPARILFQPGKIQWISCIRAWRCFCAASVVFSKQFLYSNMVKCVRMNFNYMSCFFVKLLCNRNAAVFNPFSVHEVKWKHSSTPLHYILLHFWSTENEKLWSAVNFGLHNSLTSLLCIDSQGPWLSVDFQSLEDKFSQCIGSNITIALQKIWVHTDRKSVV